MGEGGLPLLWCQLTDLEATSISYTELWTYRMYKQSGEECSRHTAENTHDLKVGAPTGCAGGGSTQPCNRMTLALAPRQVLLGTGAMLVLL